MRRTRSVYLLGFAAASITCSGAFGQTVSDEEWFNRMSPLMRSGSARPGHTGVEEEIDRAFGPLNTSRQQPSPSGIVTPHELGHKVPGKARKEYGKGLKAVEKGEHESAIEHYKNALAMDPEFCAALNDLGVSYMFTHQVDLAIEQFQRVSTIDPRAARPYSNLAIAHLIQNHFEAAENSARQQLRLDHATTAGRLLLGFSLMMQNKFTPEAEQSLRKAAADFPIAHLWLVPVLAEKGEIQPAKDQLQRYLASGDQSAVNIARDWMKQLDSASEN